MSTSPEASSPFTALIVDSLAFRVVVDSHYERFIPQASHASVAIEHAGEIPGRQMSALAGEWGLSLHLESVREGARAQYLLDFGYTPEVLNRNLELLGIDPGKINGLVVISSCGHTGIVNTVKTAMQVANVHKPHAVIGGFHLGMAPPEYIRHTVDALAALDPDVMPSVLLMIMPDKNPRL